ncbi:DUF2169 domain-containing protein [Vibrio profundum]|uniref:DUF2169 family type VI secretion system accessory protein n=1 Tax=Vibrio profundum TaxID=2910247 RepID=UPI003D1061D2
MRLWDVEPSLFGNVEGRFQRDSDGNEVWVLTLKRAWVFSDQQWQADHDVVVRDGPEYSGEPGQSALIADHDFPVIKQNSDVIAVGNARTPGKQAMTHHQCRLRIDGHVDKTIEVVGERKWVSHGGSITVSEPSTFIEKEIDYRHAVGGDGRNRLGGGVAKKNKTLLDMQVPSVFYPEQNWQPSQRKVRVAGFGVVPPHFDERRKHAGTFDEVWELERKPMMPHDFNPLFYQVAPSDQQCDGFLRGGEQLTLTGFDHYDALSFRIPSERFIAIAEFDEVLEQAMSIYTVLIDGDAKRVEMAYTAAFPCQGHEECLTVSSVREDSE